MLPKHFKTNLLVTAKLHDILYWIFFARRVPAWASIIFYLLERKFSPKPNQQSAIIAIKNTTQTKVYAQEGGESRFPPTLSRVFLVAKRRGVWVPRRIWCMWDITVYIGERCVCTHTLSLTNAPARVYVIQRVCVCVAVTEGNFIIILYLSQGCCFGAYKDDKMAPNMCLERCDDDSRPPYMRCVQFIPACLL